MWLFLCFLSSKILKYHFYIYLAYTFKTKYMKNKTILTEAIIGAIIVFTPIILILFI